MRRTLLILGVAVLAFSIIVAIILNRKPYAVLFAGMTQQETAEIASKLQEMGEDYKIEKGDTILVLKDREDRLKALLVSEGYPKSGLTYDVFTSNVGMMSTDFERKQYAILALQDRMAATIRYMNG
ncbi:MAG: flagellar M-ring protein FliF, partial [Oscillospiraceae bacterium]|nr:flagellar M-ring protein FliF [Oscillospiraceae bacterium]